MLGGVAARVIALVLLGRYHPRSGADVLDWHPTRSVETEVLNEFEDVDQMIEAQNERRRRTGRPEISEEAIRGEVEAEQRELKERAEAYEARLREPGKPDS